MHADNTIARKLAGLAEAQPNPPNAQLQANGGHAGLAQATEISPKCTIALSEWLDQRVPSWRHSRKSQSLMFPS